MGNFRSNDEDSIGDKHRISEEDDGEAGAAEDIWYLGESQFISSTGSGRNPVGDELQRKKTGEGGTLSGDVADF